MGRGLGLDQQMVVCVCSVGGAKGKETRPSNRISSEKKQDSQEKQMPKKLRRDGEMKWW